MHGSRVGMGPGRRDTPKLAAGPPASPSSPICVHFLVPRLSLGRHSQHQATCVPKCHFASLLPLTGLPKSETFLTGLLHLQILKFLVFLSGKQAHVTGLT